jgi:hypothetical protein
MAKTKRGSAVRMPHLEPLTMAIDWLADRNIRRMLGLTRAQYCANMADIRRINCVVVMAAIGFVRVI